MSKFKNVEDLSRTELEEIVSDLFTCIQDNRLRDNVTGWRTTDKGNPRPIPCSIAAHEPSWGSLRQALKGDG